MLKWNEEYFITFVGSSGQLFSTPIGKGFFCRFDAENEVKRLKARNIFSNFKIKIRKWN